MRCWEFTAEGCDDNCLYFALSKATVYTDTWTVTPVEGIDGADVANVRIWRTRRGKISHVKICSDADYSTMLARLRAVFPNAQEVRSD